MEGKTQIIHELREKLLHWQGYEALPACSHGFPGLEPLLAAFPNAVFPKGTIHEFLSPELSEAAACGGFISGLLNVLMDEDGTCIWIGKACNIYPPGLRAFRIDPSRIVFVYPRREEEVLWATEEALKCEGLTAVVAELGALNFTQSRRLQLAAEKSRTTGFLIRTKSVRLSPSLCAARWKISPLPSEGEEGLPGIAFPRWKVELLKVRNGKAGAWEVEWTGDAFRTSDHEYSTIPKEASPDQALSSGRLSPAGPKKQGLKEQGLKAS